MRRFVQPKKSQILSLMHFLIITQTKVLCIYSVTVCIPWLVFTNELMHPKAYLKHYAHPALQNPTVLIECALNEGENCYTNSLNLMNWSNICMLCWRMIWACIYQASQCRKSVLRHKHFSEWHIFGATFRPLQSGPNQFWVPTGGQWLDKHALTS